ncbi:hypothetical protein PINS_up024215 [Pythium insidiosum]|nr:hypothetical protein PINS_up024215 [Pythium insidiosum]
MACTSTRLGVRDEQAAQLLVERHRVERVDVGVREDEERRGRRHLAQNVLRHERGGQQRRAEHDVIAAARHDGHGVVAAGVMVHGNCWRFVGSLGAVSVGRRWGWLLSGRAR